MTDELCHYGIKGMRWGVRRFQNKDGSLTPSGKKRHNQKQKTKSNHRERLEEAYVERGLSKIEAKKAADKRIRTEKILAASAAVTVSACAAYVANKEVRKRIDSVIKAGESMQRIEMKNTNGELHDVFYVAKDKHDTQRYMNLLGSTRQKQTGEAYVMKLKAATDVKVASQKKASDTFKNLYDTDSSFREAMKLNGIGRKNYDRFNQNLVYFNNPDGINRFESGSTAAKKFYSSLKENGYGAIQDINDMKYSGYRAKNPLIVFDNANKNIMVESVKKIEEDLSEKGNKEMLKVTAEGLIEKVGIYGSVGLGYAALSKYTEDPSQDVYGYKSQYY